MSCIQDGFLHNTFNANAVLDVMVGGFSDPP